ncbi:MAG: hypothetical protein AAGI07_17870, partial [Bacteroidota bacterium]
RQQIDERGYYSKKLNIFADRLAEATGHPRDEMKAVISKSFETTQGKDPYTYLSDLRQSQGKPVRDQGMGVSHDPQT